MVFFNRKPHRRGRLQQCIQGAPSLRPASGSKDFKIIQGSMEQFFPGNQHHHFVKSQVHRTPHWHMC